jgi:hypothetical protein
MQNGDYTLFLDVGMFFKKRSELGKCEGSGCGKGGGGEERDKTFLPWSPPPPPYSISLARRASMQSSGLHGD